MKIKITLFTALFLTLISSTVLAQNHNSQRPKLVVQIVVSQMKYDYLTVLRDNLSKDGFVRLMEDGVNCTNARYNYLNTTSPAGLATLTTGSNPNSHGIMSGEWIDYTTNSKINLLEDKKYYGVGSIEFDGQFSPEKLISGTVGDELKKSNKHSRVISIAFSPQSAIIAGGRYADAAYWFDPGKGSWATSTYYMTRLPNWIDRVNDRDYINGFNERNWSLSLNENNYFFETEGDVINNGSRRFSLGNLFRRKRDYGNYETLTSTPIGIDMLMDMSRNMVIYENLGKDDNPDMLIITIDQTRDISESYGSESKEIEDAIYRVDYSLASFIDFLNIQVGQGNYLLIVTSDHGAGSPYSDTGRSSGGLFNVTQFKVIMNGFLNTQYGTEEWIIDYDNKSLYFNRAKAFEKGINLEEMQSKAASFAMQFRGVAHAVTSTALQNGYYAGGTMGKIQSGFHPKYSGDVVINLMPGWIEEKEGVISASGSIYEYDSHVPLIWYGYTIDKETVNAPVDMIDIAPTLSRIMKINRPEIVSGTDIIPIINNIEKQ
ncbi:MAG: alkaline phosphatase family protein [Rikenellaceae bacterium]|nr:alkaline phosphatase family protein [Rikenellaceae bacterium]